MTQSKLLNFATVTLAALVASPVLALVIDRVGNLIWQSYPGYLYFGYLALYLVLGLALTRSVFIRPHKRRALGDVFLGSSIAVILAPFILAAPAITNGYFLRP